MASQPLSVGQTALEIPVCAGQAYNATGVIAHPGQTFRFAASGRWKDAGTESGPAGYAGAGLMRLAGSFKRYPSAPWFALVGALGHDDGCLFMIGEASVWTNDTNRGAELYAFANDARFFYWNNKGRITLSITRER